MKSILFILSAVHAEEIVDFHPLMHILGDHDEDAEQWDNSGIQDKESIWAYLGHLEKLIDSLSQKEDETNFSDNV